MNLVNLTPHPVTIIRETTDPVTLPIGGSAPRLSVKRVRLTPIPQNGGPIPLCRSEMGSVVGLPDPVPGTILIVSALVAEHPSVAHRTDLAYPGEAVRDESGRIVACRGLCAGPGLASVR